MTDERRADLLAEALATLEMGGDAALARLLADHPGDESWLRERLGSLQQFGVLRGETVPDEPPKQLGEFLLKERLGAGGMGIVYRAEQPSLKREVALKVIRPEHLYFPGARERFRREVESIARLEHPGIVRVYECGEAAGLPWFTMERIDGVSLEALLEAMRARGRAPADDLELATLLAELRDARDASSPSSGAASREPSRNDPARGPSSLARSRGWVEICFRWMKDLADALAYAHGLGVLHRDIKPGNVMVTWSGRVMLLDFGLATTRGAGRITRTGSLVGSVPYMAPEQLRGAREQVDPRTDVYSLGVTLYELLSLRHPFIDTSVDETGGKAEKQDSEETRRRILDGAAPPLHKIVSAVPWDAETVCLTAMERDPARRYASTAAFAADLDHVLHFRPIAARRPGLPLRLRRFTQRHPAWSVGALLGFVLVVGGPFGLWWAQVERTRAVTREQKNTEQALTVVTTQRNEISEQRALAESRFGTALDAVVDLLSEVGYTQLNNVPNAGEVRRELLQLAEKTAQKLLSQLPDHPRARYVAGWVDQLLARVLLDRGMRADARRLLVRSIETLSDDGDGDGDDRYGEDLQRRMVHAMSENMLGGAFLAEEQWSEAEDHFAAAIEIHRAALDEVTDVAWRFKHKRQLATILMNWGPALAERFDRADEGVDSLAEACELLEEIGAGTNDAILLAKALNNLGSIHDRLGHLDQADEPFRRAVETMRAHLGSRAPDAEVRVTLAGSLMNLAIGRGKHKEYDQAVLALKESEELLRVLAREFPERLDVRTQLAFVLATLGANYFDLEEFERAEPCLRETISIYDAELRAGTATPDVHADRALAMSHLAFVVQSTDRDPEARELWKHAMRDLDAAQRKFPGSRATFDRVRGFIKEAEE